MLPGSKKLIIFDVGCYRGVFVKKMISFFDKNKIKFYLFDINKNVKNYISKLKKIKNISYQYNEVAVGNKNGKAVYNYNGFSWNQIGNDIDGESMYDRSGYSVSLSSSGNN